MKARSILLTLYAAVFLPAAAWAGGGLSNGVVDKVYHPYVLPLEREFEWRFMSRQNDSGNSLVQRLGYGQSISEHITLEGYIIGERDQSDDFGLIAIELEARWMITEQGQYWADWGALFELDKQHDEDIWEFTSGVLVEKEFGRSSLTANYLVEYEWGSVISSSFHTEFRLQYRYRFIPEIQPAIELYTGQEFVGIGPSFMGVHRFDRQKQLKWELGFIAGLNGDRKDHTLRMSLEYEF
jgi:hypothetical protein